MTQEQIDKLREEILVVISPLKESNSPLMDQESFFAVRTDAGRKLPEYYLVYFLLAELLGFKNLGRDEKVAWSFPLDFNGETFFIEHRKMGLGIFVAKKERDEEDSERICRLILRAVSMAKRFYVFVAENAIKASELNVINKNKQLFARYSYLRGLYNEQRKLALKNKGKTKIKEGTTEYGSYTSYTPLDRKFQVNANHLAISCIEAFFSWTEHLFIHLAIIANGLSNGEQVAKLVGAEWKDKFNAAISKPDKTMQKIYNDLLIVRQQLRNFVAHGAFGKDGNAFLFHSGAGAAPVQIVRDKHRNKFSLEGSLHFNDEEVLKLIDEFITHIWSGDLRPAMYYTQENTLPSILTYASDGNYEVAMTSFEAMEKFVFHLQMEFDNAGNMDW